MCGNHTYHSSSKTRSRHRRRHRLTTVVEGAPSPAPAAGVHPPLQAPLVVPLLPAVRDPVAVPRGTMERQTRITRNRDEGARRAGRVTMRKYWYWQSLETQFESMVSTRRLTAPKHTSLKTMVSTRRLTAPS